VSDFLVDELTLLVNAIKLKLMWFVLSINCLLDIVVPLRIVNHPVLVQHRLRLLFLLHD
jgi:hypothetical protein